MKAIAALSIMGLLASCASIRNNYVPETQQISFPELNVERSASIGDELVRQGTATTTNGAVLSSENNIKGIVLSPGFYPQSGEDEKYIFTNFGTGITREGIGKVTVGGGLFGAGIYPQSIRFSKEKQETCAVGPGSYGITQAACDTEHSYYFEKRPFLSENNFQQTLIYSGRVGDRIKISYREFSGSMARPAFSNEAEYDLSVSDTIAYRGAELKVLEADNQKIRYLVLSNFNTE
ncbi:MAG: hypothetical protein KDD90_00410 [Sphingomonadaceae bacterium]|jgi:hypothetical protein|nr:hypothetical protein [Sphingomonadaceae bacterium]